MAVVIEVNRGWPVAFHTLQAAGATKSEYQIPDISAGADAAVVGSTEPRRRMFRRPCCFSSVVTNV